MSGAIRLGARHLGLVVVGGAAAGAALGVVLGLAQDESVALWIAYMLYVVGALVIGVAALLGGAAPRRAAAKRLLGRDEAQPRLRTPVSDRLVLACGGGTLFAAGTVLELLL